MLPIHHIFNFIRGNPQLVHRRQHDIPVVNRGPQFIVFSLLRVHQRVFQLAYILVHTAAQTGDGADQFLFITAVRLRHRGFFGYDRIAQFPHISGIGRHQIFFWPYPSW